MLGSSVSERPGRTSFSTSVGTSRPRILARTSVMSRCGTAATESTAGTTGCVAGTDCARAVASRSADVSDNAKATRLMGRTRGTVRPDVVVGKGETRLVAQVELAGNLALRWIRHERRALD